ncbi:hypothetical protein, partial [Pseudomonas sp. 2822-17]|uniref:hypothetical protein n=1 Tax=Pseudomonas sp. 2822-17 TaxID=1712678 RepID=UPI001C46B048
YTCQTELFTLDAEELLFTDDWLDEYYDMLLDSIEEEFTMVTVRNSLGKKDSYSFSVRDLYYYEGNNYKNNSLHL